VGCIVKVNRHGFLAFQLFWNKIRSWEGTGLRDSAENRKLVEAQAVLISREIKGGAFNYLKWFPDGNRAELFKPQDAAPKTIGEYYRIWIERKTPPVIRPGLARDYRDHFGRYILPKFDETKWADLLPAMLDAFRSYLITEKKLSIKSCRNIIDASFRACCRDARTVDYLADLQGKDPFAALQWPRIKTGRPDPFDEQEREEILEYFRQKIPFYYPFVYTMFMTGMRPSEALALRWSDIDLRRHELSISKSRYLGEESGTKTGGSEREIRLGAGIAKLLKAIKPLHVTDETHVFLNQDGKPLDFRTWRGKTAAPGKTPHGVWYRALRATGIRERKPYTMRHTFISVGLSNGANIKWLADYCGTSIDMIDKHYGKYVRNDVDEQLARVFGAKTETLSETLEAEKEEKREQAVEKHRKERLVGPPGLEPGTNRL
jgi:integrase